MHPTQPTPRDRAPCPLWILVAALALVSPVACKKDTPRQGSSTTTEPAPGAGEVRFCDAVKDGVCGSNKLSFTPETAVIYTSYVAKVVPPAGTPIRLELVAADVGSAAPAGSKLLESAFTAEHDGKATTYTVKGNFQKPPEGWPKGTYRVDVHIGSTEEATARFFVE